VELESFDPEEDTEAPVMTLLGTGVLAQVIGAGTLVMLDYVNVNSAWTDPGVTVTDNVDLDEDVRSFALWPRLSPRVLSPWVLFRPPPSSCDSASIQLSRESAPSPRSPRLRHTHSHTHTHTHDLFVTRTGAL
jgi:hypothetical protein